MIGRSLTAFALLFALATEPALEATTTGTLAVTASVAANCVVAAPVALDFGTYKPAANATAPEASAEALSIACTSGSPGVTIGLDNGRKYAGAHRNMQSGDDQTVAYDVYTSADSTTEWSLTDTVAYVSTSSQPAAIVLYGRVLPGQNPRPGHYSDALLAMVNF